MIRAFLPVIFFLWAGIAIGGNMIAAPAKFQVSSLSIAELLMIGRAQFTWLGYAEWLLLALSLTLIILGGRKYVFLPAIAYLIFFLQQIWLQPLLETRTNLIQLGQAPQSNSLHIYFVVLEMLKIAFLIAAGFRVMLNEEVR